MIMFEIKSTMPCRGNTFFKNDISIIPCNRILEKYIIPCRHDEFPKRLKYHTLQQTIFEIKSTIPCRGNISLENDISIIPCNRILEDYIIPCRHDEFQKRLKYHKNLLTCLSLSSFDLLKKCLTLEVKG